MPENDSIRKAIQMAEQERNSLLDKLKEYEEIKQRLSQLEVFINTGKNLLGIDVGTSAVEKLTPISSFSGEKMQRITHEEGVKKILIDAGRALSLSDIVQEYRKRNWNLSEKNGREVIRQLIGRKGDMFKKELVGNKTFISLVI